MSDLNTKNVLAVYDALAKKYPEILKRVPRDRVALRIEVMENGTVDPKHILEKALKSTGGEKEILNELVNFDDIQSPPKIFNSIFKLTHEGWNLPEEVSEEPEESKDLTEDDSKSEDSSEDINSLLKHIEPIEKGSKNISKEPEEELTEDNTKSVNEEKLEEEDMSSLFEGVDSVDEESPEPSEPSMTETEQLKKEVISEGNNTALKTSNRNVYCEEALTALKKTVIRLCKERAKLKSRLKPHITEEMDTALRDIAMELSKDNIPFSPAELRKVYNRMYDKKYCNSRFSQVILYWLDIGFIKRYIVGGKPMRGYYLLTSK